MTRPFFIWMILLCLSLGGCETVTKWFSDEMGGLEKAKLDAAIGELKVDDAVKALKKAEDELKAVKADNKALKDKLYEMTLELEKTKLALEDKKKEEGPVLKKLLEILERVDKKLVGIDAAIGPSVGPGDIANFRSYQLQEEMALVKSLYSIDNEVPLLSSDQSVYDRYQRFAKEGNWKSLYYLALSKKLGQGLPQNIADACELFLQLASQGHGALAVNSLYEVGICYEKSHFIAEKPAQEAFAYFLQAAEKGHIPAKFRVGYMWQYGIGVPADQEEAFQWIYQAAQGGHVAANFLTGLAYDFGLGTPPSSEQAIFWYQRASDADDAMAAYNLGALYATGRGVEKNVEKSLELIQKAADDDFTLAQFHLGYIYDVGADVDPDPAKALLLYETAAESENVWAQYNLGILHFTGTNLPRDYSQSIKWWKRALAHQIAPAQKNLGILYENGLGVSRDLEKALELYQKSAGQGDPIAQEALKRFN